MRVDIRRVAAPLRAPWPTARGDIDRRELLLVELEDKQGHVGRGEAAPLESYDGVPVDAAHAALEDCRALLSEADGDDHAQLLDECARLAVLPQAVAAVDLALWDLAGQRKQEPVWRLLGAAGAHALEVNYTVSASDRTGAAGQASQARREGFSCLKAKVGIGDDAGRLAAIRAAAGPEMGIRIDPNGTWSVDEALAALRQLEPVGLELCEEPVRGLEAMDRLSGLTDVPLALDETSISPGALDQRVCSAVCLKISRCGGITGVTRAAQRARAAGYELYLSSTLDGPLGIAAAIHAAAVIGPDRPCGLATLAMFDGRADPLPPLDGWIPLPAGPGLGTGLAEWYDG